jgi:hypothetical protein
VHIFIAFFVITSCSTTCGQALRNSSPSLPIMYWNPLIHIKGL